MTEIRGSFVNGGGMRAVKRAAPILFVVFITFFWIGLRAYADDSVAMQMDLPSRITPFADKQLITSITRCGTRLVAVGARGRILYSQNNGKSWHQVATPTSATLTEVAFADQNVGWAVGQMGVVLHTADGGKTWVKQYDGIQAANTMLAAAKSDIVLHGVNSATTANLQAAQQMVAGGPNVPFLAVLAMSPVRAIIMGAFGLAFSTSDGGRSWQPLADSMPNPNGYHVYGLTRDAGLVFAVGESGFVLKGQFDGMYKTLMPPFQGTLFGAVATKAGTLLVYGLQGTVLVSSNQGSTWKQSKSGVSVGIDSGTILQNGDILLGDIAGDLLLSKDDGTSFSAVSTSQPVVGLSQAVDGSIITGGPLGVEAVKLSALFPSY